MMVVTLKRADGDAPLVLTMITRKTGGLTLPFLLCTRRAIPGEVSSRRDSCSDSFFLNRSITFDPLLALWRSQTKTTHLQKTCQLHFY